MPGPKDWPNLMENGSRRIQALFIHSPRLPSRHRRTAAIRKQFKISRLLRGGCPDRQTPLGNGSGHFGFAERILPRFGRRALLRFLRSGWTRKSLGGHPPARKRKPRARGCIRSQEKRPLRTNSPTLQGHALPDFRRWDRILLENRHRGSSLARAFGGQLLCIPRPDQRKGVHRFARR